MFLKQTVQANGRINLSIVEGYRDATTKTSKHRVVKNLGYADEYTHLYEDPIAHFKEVAREMTRQAKEKKAKKEVALGSVFADEVMSLQEESLKSLGFIPLSILYHQLKLDEFFTNRQRRYALRHSLNDIVQLLVYSRILAPYSNNVNFLPEEIFATDFDEQLEDLYHALDVFAHYKDDFLLFLHEQIRLQYGRDTHQVFHNLANHYFELGPEYDHKQNTSANPFVQMGLLLDADAIPITYQLFPEGMADSQSMVPVLHGIRKDYDIDRLIAVSDTALDSGINVAFLQSEKDGFIFSQKIRGGGKELLEYVFDPTGYRKIKGIIKERLVPRKNIKEELQIKSRPFPQKFWVADSSNTKGPVPIEVRQIVCYNETDARNQKHKRDEAVELAKRIIRRPSRWNKKDAFEALRYINNINYDPQTGEYIRLEEPPVLNEEQIAEDERYDGYYALITSEVDMSDFEVIRIYHDLWQTERGFRVTKSYLHRQMMFPAFKPNIEAHFLIFFLALLLVRLLCKSLQNEYSFEQVVLSLRMYRTCFIKDNIYRNVYYDEILDSIGKTFDLPLDQRYLTSGSMRNLIASSKKI